MKNNSNTESGEAGDRRRRYRRQRRVGTRVKSKNCGWDCLTHMQLFRNRPDVLASALREMGVTESGDEPRDQE